MELLQYLVILFIKIVFLHFGIPLIVFCDGDDKTSSEEATDAGVGAQESIETLPQGEGGSNIDASPASRKRKEWIRGMMSAPLQDEEGWRGERIKRNKSHPQTRGVGACMQFPDKWLNLSSDKEGDAASEPSTARAPALGEADPRKNPNRTHPASVGPSDPYRSAALMEEKTPVAQPPIQERPVDQPSLESFAKLLETHERISERIKDLFRDLHTRVPGGFQAERLTEMLEERHGGEKMSEILQSLQTEGDHSPYFREVQTDFLNLRHSGVTEMVLRREWQGKGEH